MKLIQIQKYKRKEMASEKSDGKEKWKKEEETRCIGSVEHMEPDVLWMRVSLYKKWRRRRRRRRMRRSAVCLSSLTCKGTIAMGNDVNHLGIQGSTSLWKKTKMKTDETVRKSVCVCERENEDKS